MSKTTKDTKTEDPAVEQEVDATEATTAPAAPAWMAEDYAGPITADQSAQRIARFGHHVTKPAADPVTK